MPFTDEMWDAAAVQSNLEAADYCRVCLIDTNEGRDKIKSKCKLPLRKSPGAPYNKRAIRNAMGRIFQLKGISANAKRTAARRLVRLAREAEIAVGQTILRLAGMK